VRRLSVVLVPFLVLWFSAGAAFADTVDDLCGDDPNCTVEGWDGGGADAGIPGWFIALFVLAALVAVGMTIYRVSTARDMATKAGLDPDDATRVALLDDDGVSAAYLASQLHGRASDQGATAPRSTAERLQELQALRDQGLVTEAEYAERRAAILGTI
jgi:hypothetical protein